MTGLDLTLLHAFNFQREGIGGSIGCGVALVLHCILTSQDFVLEEERITCCPLNSMQPCDPTSTRSANMPVLIFPGNKLLLDSVIWVVNKVSLPFITKPVSFGMRIFSFKPTQAPENCVKSYQNDINDTAFCTEPWKQRGKIYSVWMQTCIYRKPFQSRKNKWRQVRWTVLQDRTGLSRGRGKTFWV